MVVLSVNVDHIATVRQARRGLEPDPVLAAADIQRGGAGGVTVHLREDRRHIQEHDVLRLARATTLPLNFEMAATDDMVAFAISLQPASAMLVPEGRQEITTEGGLDVAADQGRLRGVIGRLSDAGIPASAFIDGQERQIAAAAACGFAVCEVHTGPWAEAVEGRGDRQTELERVADAGRLITQAGMRFNAGHALNYLNVQQIGSLPDLQELHIGHAIVSRAIFTGMQQAVREMVDLIETAPT
jgi:pyridoxine 5-phosphate synthase